MDIQFSGKVIIGSFRNPKTGHRDLLGQQTKHQIRALISHPDFRHYMGINTTVRITRSSANGYHVNMHNGKVGDPFIDLSGRLTEMAAPTSLRLWLSRIDKAFRKPIVPAPFSVEYLRFKRSWIQTLQKLLNKTLSSVGYTKSKPAF